MDTKRIAAKLSELLGLVVAPVAVTFRPSAPAGVKRVERAGPAGCAYWRSAAEGRVFYTEAEDHFNCPVGSHTHGITLPPGRSGELEGVVGIMVSLQYLRTEEVPEIPRRQEPFGVAIYAPLADTPVDPDVVLVRGNARQIMLVAEAARAAGVGHDGPTLGRPACSMIPEAMRAARGNTSLGCIGNRVYTGLDDGDLYFTIPGAALPRVVETLSSVAHANRELAHYHQARRQAIGTPPRA